MPRVLQTTQAQEDLLEIWLNAARGSLNRADRLVTAIEKREGARVAPLRHIMRRFDSITVIVRLVLAAFFLGCASVIIGGEPLEIGRVVFGGLLTFIGISFGAAAWFAFLRRG